MSEALASKIGIEGIFYAAILSTVAISLFWKWWRSRLGWTIVAKSMALAIAVMPAMVYFWFGHRAPAWLTYVAIGGLWLVPPILFWRVFELWLVQRKGAEIR